jgi:hypothetical protein
VGVVLDVAGVVDQRDSPGYVVLLELVAEVVAEHRWSGERAEARRLEVALQRDLKRAADPAGRFHDAFVAGPFHPVQKRHRVAHQVVVLVGVVAQPEVAEARRPVGDHPRLEAPSLHQRRRGEARGGKAAAAEGEAGGGVEGAVGGDSVLVLRGLPVPKPRGDEGSVVRSAAQVGK